MKSIVYTKYGSPEVLRCEEIEKPIAGDNEVLIKVHAASVNPLDWHFMRGTPYGFRLMTGLRKPKITRLGVDIAGEVEAIGRYVTKFKPGDEVFGSCRGAFAEYVCSSEQALVKKPTNLTFEQAASVPVAGITALQALRDHGRIQAGYHVLINGASGGVGTFAVQIAKSFGADVTGVCSTSNVEMVRSIGTDRVIDYTREDFSKGGQRYDLILDAIGNHSLSAIRNVLNPRGIWVGVGGPTGRWKMGLTGMIKALALSRFVSQNFTSFIAKLKEEDLIFLRDLIQAGKVTPVIDRQYQLHEVPEAIRYLEQGHARGKVVITVR
jgi:NADPH:quinone reductase-like Zn-dependent oxidoreductase